MEIVNKVKSFQKRSNKAIGLFQKTVADLAAANALAEKEVQKRTDKIIKEKEKAAIKVSKLEKEQKELVKGAEVNAKVIDKVNEFLGITE